MNPLEVEAAWWGDCTNTTEDEHKQFVYARRMGIAPDPDGRWWWLDVRGAAIADVGGGPASLLLKCQRRGACAVVDPCPYPDWTAARYAVAGIELIREPAETAEYGERDEVWIYNVLQHVDDPELVLRRARARARTLRVFEWVGVPADPKHPHVLTRANLELWSGLRGTMEWLDRDGCHGDSWAAVG